MGKRELIDKYGEELFEEALLSLIANRMPTAEEIELKIIQILKEISHNG